MPSTLRKRISSFKPLRAVSAADRQMLAICLAASFVCWLILKLTGTYSTQRSFRVNYLVPENKVLLTDLPQSMTATIQGRGWSLLQYSFSSRPLEVDYDLGYIFSEGRVNENELRTQANATLRSSSLSVERIEFIGADVRLALKTSKRVPISGALNLSYPPGLIAKSNPRLQPDSVLVYGSEEQLAAIDSWSTDSLVRQMGAEGLAVRLALAAPPQGVELTPDSVQLNIPVEAYADRTFYVPVSVRGNSQVDSFRIFPDRVELKVALRQSAYEAVTADSFLIVADVRNLPTSSTRNVVTLRLEQQPQGVVSVQFQERTANYFIYD